MGAYTKSIWAALMAGLTTAVTVLSNDPSTSKWVTVAISVVTVAGVLVGPNLPKTAADDLNALLVALHPTTPEVISSDHSSQPLNTSR